MKRQINVDLLRGFIMILMAIDHASGMVANVHFMEVWGLSFKSYPTILWWLTRFVSHLCATGFFFLMGISIYLFNIKRKAIGWDNKRIKSYFIKRGCMIISFIFFLEGPAWLLSGLSKNVVKTDQLILPGNFEGGFFIPTSVLYGLGMCLIIGSFLSNLKPWQLLSITFGAFGLSSWYIYGADPTSTYNALEILCIVPGISSGVMSIYPIIPWIGVTAFGIFWGQSLYLKKDNIYLLSLKTGVLLITLFIGLRYMEIGNFHMNSYHDWVSFFTLVKYPPSVCFILITLGINLILFYAFSKVKNAFVIKPLLLFGQTALFFYILHLYVYAFFAAFFPTGCSILTLYIIWFLGLIICYFGCKKFLKFKKAKPADSLWRLI